MQSEPPPIRFLLDEHYPGWLANILTAGGINTVALTAHRPDLRGVDDLTVLEAAIAERRVVVTEDVATQPGGGGPSLAGEASAGASPPGPCRLERGHHAGQNEQADDGHREQADRYDDGVPGAQAIDEAAEDDEPGEDAHRRGQGQDEHREQRSLPGTTSVTQPRPAPSAQRTATSRRRR